MMTACLGVGGCLNGLASQPIQTLKQAGYQEGLFRLADGKRQQNLFFPV